jgi:predicted transcriptional regulator
VKYLGNIPRVKLPERIVRYYRRDYLALPEDTSLAKAIERLLWTNLRTIYVNNGNTLAGLFNLELAKLKFQDRNNRRLLSKQLTEITLREIMDSYTDNDDRLVGLRQTLRTAATRLNNRPYLNELPVVKNTANNRVLVGKITIWDILQVIQSKIDGGIKVRDLAYSDPLKCRENHNLFHVISLLNLSHQNYNAIIVVDEKERPVGVINRYDLPISIIRQFHSPTYWSYGDTFFSDIAFFTTAGQVMSRSFYEVYEDDDLRKVISWMIQTRTEVYPVMDKESKKLTMVISARDIISSLVL